VTYRAAVTFEGRESTLTVERRFKAGPGKSVLAELSVVHVSLHDAAQPDGPPLAVGTLATDLNDLRTLAGSIRPLEPDSPAAGAEALARLGRFIFGQVYDACLRRPWWRFWG
jgi:hypothetical protein